jgi:hypothetical protein
MPDGQRVLNQCYTEQDCARGFRVPLLYRKPDALASDLLARVRAAMAAPQPKAVLSRQPHLQLPQDEAVDVVGTGNTIHIAGLAAAMQNGRYTYTVRPLSGSATDRTGLTLDKTSRSIAVVVPGPGLYDLTFTDSLNSPRIDVLVAAVTVAQRTAILKSFEEVRERLKDWNEDNQGWPIHDVQRAYLESLMMGIRPRSVRAAPPSESPRAATTVEPRFTPPPGVLKGATGIILQSDTPGAVIHYTVDGSQPFLSSPAYEAPIMAKRTALTIKAFATAPGKKDSAVVTATFRFEE